jgi:hypothetical protein
MINFYSKSWSPAPDERLPEELRSLIVELPAEKKAKK